MDYSIPNEEQILHTWFREQTYSMKHWALVAGLAIMTFLSFESWGIMVAGYVIIFLLTALPRIFNIVIYAIIATILTALIPPLGIILTVIFFFMRIGYIMENWRALLSGVIFYAYPIIFIVNRLGSHRSVGLGTALFCAAFAGLGLHLILCWLYKNKYSTTSALSTMGASPVFFFMLILPFIAHSIHDFIDFNDYNDYSAAYAGAYVAHADIHYTNTDVTNPGVHHVDGHWRSTPSGGETYVDPYIRTNPDGIEENNFSHKG